MYLDGKFGFGLDLETFTKFHLKIDQQLSDQEIEKIVEKAEFQKTSDKLLRFATLRPRSKKEIDTWLKKHKIHESLHDKLFNKLKRLELIDDKKFAEWWVGQRLHFKLKSKRELIAELRVKGIGKDTINNLLNKVNVDERGSAQKLLKKRQYKWERLSGFEARKKKSEYLARKGFGWDVIKKVVADT